ncbi:hypothetical protein [Streptomyces parvus]|uniref:hypothetical protein n=1 Tax=Streptomyces parvus TaxID=66428 RepID=UPI0035DD46ED
MTQRLRACAAVVQLTSQSIAAVRRATAASSGAGLPELIHTVLRCPLQSHPATVDHQALVSELFGRSPGDIWASWAGCQQPHAYTEAAYCPAEDAPATLCLSVEQHPGAHSWQVDPLAPAHLTAFRRVAAA